jgi:tetratricopeptide (TPR) repeat protein
MKKAFFYLALITISMGAYAQIQTPAPSPLQKIEQKVGLTDITVEYSRPSMKGRKIFGGLENYNEIWRTGANGNTTVSFSDNVMIGGKEVKAGKYALYTKPGIQNWDVYFYSKNDNWGEPEKWDESLVVASVNVPVNSLPMDIETFTISFDNLKNDSAELGLMWENTYVAIPIQVATDEMVSASINRVMNGPGANDYYSAAVYYLESGKDINKAKEWIDKAVEMRSDAFWYYRQQSLIYAKSGDKKGAIKAAQKSLELAQKAGNNDYVALNTKSLKEWGAM